MNGHVWKMNVYRPDDEDLFVFAEQNEGKFVSVVKREVRCWKMVKTQFSLDSI